MAVASAVAVGGGATQTRVQTSGFCMRVGNSPDLRASEKAGWSRTDRREGDRERAEEGDEKGRNRERKGEKGGGEGETEKEIESEREKRCMYIWQIHSTACGGHKLVSIYAGDR